LPNILVTGGAGYIGAHCCKVLARAGFTPVTLDNLVHGHAESVRWGPLVIGDVADRALLDKLFGSQRIEAVIHFAAFAHVGQSVVDPGAYYRNNVAAMLTLLEAMRDHHVPILVFSSSCATYGLANALPISEGHRQEPINPYGASKLMGERMAADFSSAHRLRTVSLRYFNAAGADPDGDIGEWHEPETHLIPLALRATEGRSPLAIFGNDYPTPDGTCVRDYVHVTDLAEAHVAALRQLRAGQALPPALNLGTGAGYSVQQIIAEVERVTGKCVSRTVAARRQGDPPVLVADASVAKAALGWTPRFGDLDQIVASAWHWHCRQREGGHCR
jgi:UDP-arabinose 4-epimerase